MENRLQEGEWSLGRFVQWSWQEVLMVWARWWQERWRQVIFWKQNSCDFLTGWMSRVKNEEESRAAPKFLGNWVDLLSWKRWRWGWRTGLMVKIKGPIVSKQHLQCPWDMQMETLSRQLEVPECGSGEMLGQGYIWTSPSADRQD